MSVLLYSPLVLLLVVVNLSSIEQQRSPRQESEKVPTFKQLHLPSGPLSTAMTA